MNTKQIVRVDLELLQSCLEIMEDMWLPCDDECECIIHALRAALGLPDDR